MHKCHLKLYVKKEASGQRYPEAVLGFLGSEYSVMDHYEVGYVISILQICMQSPSDHADFNQQVQKIEFVIVQFCFSAPGKDNLFLCGGGMFLRYD